MAVVMIDIVIVEDFCTIVMLYILSTKSLL